MRALIPFLSVLMATSALAAEPEPVGSAGDPAAEKEKARWPASKPGYKPLKFNLNEEGTQWVRFITWHQIWLRGIQNNPGTTVLGQEQDATVDVGLRRARFLVLGEALHRTQFLFHVGMNNQTFANGRKPQLYVHDAWASYAMTPGGELTIGAGLHYWNGVSRLNNQSTLNMLSVDMPISNWLTIERTDQFARMMGIFAKGHKGPFAYRVALNKPFSTSRTLVPDGPADYNPQASTLATAGYLELQLDDQESDLLPYKVGTYLGKKSVFNVGAGWLWHPDAVATANADGDITARDLTAFGVDVFADQPVGENGAAFTGYAGYWYYDFGPDAVRNIGIMNNGAGGTSFNGGGNAYPVLGTGHTVYAQAGFLLPGRPGGVQIQPYATTQVSILDALGAPMIAPEVGVNWLIHGHNAKITTHWRSRPVFEAGTDPEVESRANEGIVQLAVFL